MVEMDICKKKKKKERKKKEASWESVKFSLKTYFFANTPLKFTELGLEPFDFFVTPTFPNWYFYCLIRNTLDDHEAW